MTGVALPSMWAAKKSGEAAEYQCSVQLESACYQKRAAERVQTSHLVHHHLEARKNSV
jgi:hypothetical protein